MAGVNITVHVDGSEEVMARLEKLAVSVDAKVKRTLYTEAELIMTDSKANYVPVDLGTLMGSGYVTQPKKDKDGMFVTLGYGGAAEAYAWYQHENMEINHPGRGGPKYLERPVFAAQGRVKAALLKDVLEAEAEARASDKF